MPYDPVNFDALKGGEPSHAIPDDVKWSKVRRRCFGAAPAGNNGGRHE